MFDSGGMSPRLSCHIGISIPSHIRPFHMFKLWLQFELNIYMFMCVCVCMCVYVLMSVYVFMCMYVYLPYLPRGRHSWVYWKTKERLWRCSIAVKNKGSRSLCIWYVHIDPSVFLLLGNSLFSCSCVHRCSVVDAYKKIWPRIEAKRIFI